MLNDKKNNGFSLAPDNTKPSGSLIYRIIKRSFDVLFSAVLMIPVGILIGIFSFAIKLDDGGSVFYMAERTGRFGKTFKMFKLRSMKENAPDIRLADGSTYNGDDDPRVTRFGKFARKTSVIGPRPDTPIGSAAYTDEEKIILTVRPGITGYNQAINRNSVLTKEKLANDIYYVRHLSLWFDIKIIFMTLMTVLKRKNVNRDGANLDDTFVLENEKETTEIK